MCNNDITKIKRAFLGHCDKLLLVAALDTFRLHRVYAVYRNVLSKTSTLVSDIIMSFIEYCLYRVYNKLYVLVSKLVSYLAPRDLHRRAAY